MQFTSASETITVSHYSEHGQATVTHDLMPYAYFRGRVIFQHNLACYRLKVECFQKGL